MAEQLSEPFATDRRIARGLDDAYVKAVTALAGYKFVMFGYHASQWVLLNRMAHNKRPNPFRYFVRHARELKRKIAAMQKDL